MGTDLRTYRRGLAASVIACVATASTGCASRPAPQAAETAAAVGEAGGDYRTLGKASAQVVVIEFTDLQCPFCASFALRTFPALRSRYIDTGLVRFESHDLPLPFHPFAVPAAVAARCAGEQGRFWDYREALFRRQGQLPSAPYDAIATTLGLDLAKFTSCRDEPRVKRDVLVDAELARANGIDGTPAFVVGRMEGGRMEGELIQGAQPLEVFTEKLDALLAQ
jgi:protein-disulfide isomerase